MFRVVVRAATLLALAGSTGCGSNTPPLVEAPAPLAAASQPPVPLQVDQPFFIAGEQLVWNLSLHGILGGEALVMVGEPGLVDGRRQIILRSRMETAGAVKLIKEVRDEITTWVALDDGRPIQLRGDLKFGDKELLLETSFHDTGYTITYQRRQDRNPRNYRQNRLPAGTAVYDTHSLIGVIRAWVPEVGSRAYFYALAGRRLWRNHIRFTGQETIRTELGLNPALRFDGVATRLTNTLGIDQSKKPRSYSVWISDDARRAPLLLTASTEYGEIKVELVSYEKPDQLPHLAAR